MAKKTKKTKQADAGSAKQAQARIKKKAVVMREEHPGLVFPLIAWALILLLLGAGEKYGVLDRVFSIWIGGGVTIALLAFAPVYYNKKYLSAPGCKPLLTVMVVLMIAACGALIWFGSWSRPPVFEGKVSIVQSRVQTDLSAGVYAFLINGSFKEEQEEPKKDKKTKTKSKQYRGDYRIALSATGTGEPVKQFSGRFEHLRKRRKLSKKARGYQEIQRTSDFKPAWVKSRGSYEIRLAELTGDLESEMDVAVYKKGVIPYILAGLGIVCILLGNMIDHVIRRVRITSVLGPAMGAAFGFSAYFYFESSPVTRYQTMAMDILIGGFVGVMIAYGLYSPLKKYYEKIAAARKMNL